MKIYGAIPMKHGARGWRENISRVCMITCNYYPKKRKVGDSCQCACVMIYENWKNNQVAIGYE